MKNVEASSADGKFDPSAGLALSGIAGTIPDKEEEDKQKKDAEVKEDEVQTPKSVIFLFIYFFGTTNYL